MKKDTIYTTISTGDGKFMLQPLEPIIMQKAYTKNERTLVIDPSKTDQPMLGMGGTWTDTDVYNLLRMNRTEQDKVLTALFHPEEGAGWNFMRLPFGSTDWESTCDYYTYNDMPRGEKDWKLASFSIQRDIDRGLFELVRRCKAINPDVIFLGSVWGVPGWMKENDSIMFGRFNPECTQVYAEYLRKTVQAYKEQGVELYAITTQNEALTSDDRATPACRFTWRMQKDVILALKKEFITHGIDTEIWIFDHNFDLAHAFVDPMLADKDARAVVDGVAMHDYGGSPTEMGRLKELHPDMPFYMTERFISTVSEMGRYVQQLRNGARSYIQWSTMADEYGGPFQFLGRPFVYHKPRDEGQRTFIYNLYEDANKWYKAPAYGLYGQFTKFLSRGMTRIDCTGGHEKWVTAVAFKDDEGKIALVVVNQTAEEQSFTLRIGGAEAVIKQQAESVATYEILPGELAGSEVCAVADSPQLSYPVPDAFDLQPMEIMFGGDLKEGEEIALSCRVRNVGNLPTPNRATLKVQFHLDGECDIARSTTCVAPILPGGDVVVECNVPYGKKVTWTAEAGYHTIFALVEIGNCHPELNTDNSRLGGEVFIHHNLNIHY